ncbi:hypothetical protein HMPREF9441_00474 [Paraprevotella clara YIT 11840]|jgi:hypothetical protein|uniref:Uncharacterized protein n=1 Tax=Paraprevotella clara YIT 11840 TaxID=762968 RepID=G5SMA0_9BACT|nr:hypothetical protein HMPREF9441_00474 [Paraprevotella clara YIT 11840]RGU57944.1 hypothetical protein DWW55_18625 [Paraprevotella clara]
MKGVFGKTLVGRREAFDVHKKEILTTSSRSVQDSFSVRLIGLKKMRYFISMRIITDSVATNLFLMKK